MPARYSTGGHVSWNDAVHEKGAVSNVLISVVILFALVYFFSLVTPKIELYLRHKKFTDKEQYKFLFILCGVFVMLAIFSGVFAVAIPGIILFAAVMLTKIFPAAQVEQTEFSESVKSSIKRYLIYDGENLHFTIGANQNILTKRFPFYNSLTKLQQDKFLSRIQKFIDGKIFVIHDTAGFKEMPVLISAAAIQLSFGLEKYLMPVFKEIHIYPDEFISVHNGLKVVVGNVSNHCINISWKHFLDGFEQYDNGVNVGLHEMAHAYHYQNFASITDTDKHFKTHFPLFEIITAAELSLEKKLTNQLYTTYGLSNSEEFWAESVELFFEKPSALMTSHKCVYDILKDLLKQDPALNSQSEIMLPKMPG